MRTIGTTNAASASSSRSVASRRISLPIRDRGDLFDDTCVDQLLKERQEIGLAALGSDVVLGDDRSLKVGHAGWRLEELPDARAHRVEPVIATLLEPEDDRLAPDVGRHLLPGGGHNCIGREHRWRTRY